MNGKQEILELLQEEFQQWCDLPAMMAADQRSERILPGGLSLKDLYAHLMSWQQRTIARLEAAVEGRDLRFPAWPAHLDPDSEGEQLDALNAWFFEQHRDRPWAEVYRDWRSGYERVIELAKQVPESDMLQPGRYPWLSGRPLSAVLEGTYSHHHEEHLEPLLAWLSARGE